MSNEKKPMLEQLDDISSTVEGLKVCVQRQGADTEMQDKLTCIWEITQELQRAITRPEVVQAYKDDAMNQILRVRDLIYSLSLWKFLSAVKDDTELATELLHLAYAGELMVEKIRKYLQINRPAVLKAVAAKTTEGA